MHELKRHVQVAHAEEVVVDKELEDVGDVRLVGLELLAEDRSTLEKVRYSSEEIWVVQLDAEELVLALVETVVGAVRKVNIINSNYLKKSSESSKLIENF